MKRLEVAAMNKLTAIYCRVAHPATTAVFTAALQRESLIRYAKEHGYENIVCYEDIGFNGLALTGRPSFQGMQKDIDAGNVQMVIVRSLDRIGRNTAEVVGWLSGLRSKGIEFIAAVHPDISIELLQKLYGTESGVTVNE